MAIIATPRVAGNKLLKQTAKCRLQKMIMLLIITICIVALPLAGCKNDEPTTTGETPEQPIDNITDSAGNKIPIYKTDGVSDAEAATAVTNIKTAFNHTALNPYKNILSIGITKVYLLAGDSEDLYSFDKATGILKVGASWTVGTYRDYFQYGVYPALTKYTLSFGTAENPCTVTIKSDDQFTASEWKTLCDKVVAAVERGYRDAPNDGMRTNITNYFASNTVSAVLLKSATNDVEVKSTVPKTIHFKANSSSIDGISGSILFNVIAAMMGNASYPTP